MRHALRECGTLFAALEHNISIPAESSRIVRLSGLGLSVVWCVAQDVPTVRGLVLNHRGVRKVCLYSKTRVAAGEELTMDYGPYSRFKVREPPCRIKIWA